MIMITMIATNNQYTIVNQIIITMYHDYYDAYL